MNALLESVRLCRRFPVSGSRTAQVFAVDDVSFTIGRGEAVGLVGESGCGKSTLVRMLARLIDTSAGTLLFDGQDIAALPAAGFPRHPLRSKIQMVFQDPTDSLNPRMTALETIAEPLKRLRGIGTETQRRPLAEELANAVGLPVELLSRFPHQLSGGQKARVGIARALASDPRLLILDEPTSALDVSVQAIILKLLARLRRERGLSYLFVSHDLNVVRLLCDRLVVMYLGRIVETGPTADVFASPKHPYTRALISAIPGHGERIRLAGEVRSPIDPPPTVCRFYGRCPRGELRCAEAMPQLATIGERQVACHFA
ncbi:MAG TPA: ABC transporter ATP-binding protein [Burkholderiaceae bacterium]|nr:ABC transporter ATP-binding protein [Burkholderiaceae bacterium]